jgi:hypothetical protein
MKPRRLKSTDESRHSRAADMPSLNEAVVDATEVYPLGSSSGESARLQRQAEELAPDRAVLLDMSCVADPEHRTREFRFGNPKRQSSHRTPCGDEAEAVHRLRPSGAPSFASPSAREFESSSPDLVAAAATNQKRARGEVADDGRSGSGLRNAALVHGDRGFA